ncbi:MAG: hypothetical protein ABIT08_07675 [Bacteroidia bacterium]
MRKLRGGFIYISLNPAVEIIIGCEDTADGENVVCSAALVII